MSKVVVLEGSEDERNPTEEEVIEYAEFLDIDPETEPHLLWIAREGVVAPVPAPWKACTESGDDVFYFNFETGESVWDHPSDAKYKEMVEEERAKHKAAKAKGNTATPERLKLITNEISDEDSISPKSQKSQKSQASHLDESLASSARGDTIQPISMLNDSVASSSTVPKSSPSKQANDGRGTAGVGLAPSANLSIDSVDDERDRTVDTEQSSPNHSQSGSCPKLPSGKNGNLPTTGGRAALEHSGASGQSGRSELYSEVSEELVSDFDGPSDALSQHGRATPVGDKMDDSLELSATFDHTSNGKADMERQESAAKPGQLQDVKGKPGCNRVNKLQDELASLSRILSKLSEIRGQQREFVDLLQLSSS